MREAALLNLLFHWLPLAKVFQSSPIARVLANKYIHFAELPPAKGKSRLIPDLYMKGQIIMVQAAELMQARKIIPDIHVQYPPVAT